MPKPFSSKQWAAKYFPILKVAGDPGTRAPVALNKAVCVVGRRLGVHLPLNSTKVSKLHALIVRQRGGVYIRDLASRNHLYVNDQPVTETDLETGDVVRVGPYTLHCASGFTPRDGDGDGDGADDGLGAPEPLLASAAAAAARAPEAALQLVGEPDRRVPLDGRAILIGQRDECDLTLSDERVSPVHAVIFELDGKRFLRDLNSSAGAFVNNQTVHQHELEAGDEIRIGRVRIRYDVEGAALPDDPASPNAPADDAIHLSQLDTELVEVDADDSPAADPSEEADLIPVHIGDRAVGLIDAAVQAIAADLLPPHKDDPDVRDPLAAAPPLSIQRSTAGDADWPRRDLVHTTPPGADVRPELRADPDEVPVADTFDETAPDHADAAPSRPPGATRKLDQIVTELSEKVAELETTWNEVKHDAASAPNDPERAADVPRPDSVTRVTRVPDVMAPSSRSTR